MIYFIIIMMNSKERVYEIVSTIPLGRVATYGMIARMADTGPRAVGTYLHQNKEPKTYPCHRVVHSDGSMAGGYVFGGSGEQLLKLKKEKVIFKGAKVNLKESLWIPN